MTKTGVSCNLCVIKTSGPLEKELHHLPCIDHCSHMYVWIWILHLKHATTLWLQWISTLTACPPG